MEQTYSIAEVAVITGLTPNAVEIRALRGTYPGIAKNGTVRIPKDWIDEHYPHAAGYTPEDLAEMVRLEGV